MNSGIVDCVFKIINEDKKKNYVNWIFLFIPFKNIKILLTNNHVLNLIFLDNEKN